MAPDVVLERRDIEVAEQDHSARVMTPQSGGCPHLFQEGKLVRELGISRGVGEIAAGRYIQVMNRDGIAKPRAFAEHGRNVPAVALAAKRLDVEAFERADGKAPRRRDNPSVR